MILQRHNVWDLLFEEYRKDFDDLFEVEYLVSLRATQDYNWFYESHYVMIYL